MRQVLSDLLNEHFEVVALRQKVEVEVYPLRMRLESRQFLNLFVGVFPPKRVGIGQEGKGDICRCVLLHEEAKGSVDYYRDLVLVLLCFHF